MSRKLTESPFFGDDAIPQQGQAMMSGVVVDDEYFCQFFSASWHYLPGSKELEEIERQLCKEAASEYFSYSEWWRFLFKI
jgi:hypothetical protein